MRPVDWDPCDRVGDSCGFFGLVQNDALTQTASVVVAPETPAWVVEGDETVLVAQMQRFAAGLGAGDILLMHGPMGAGKTTLTRAIAAAVGVRRPQRVCSPTYNVAMEHLGPLPLVHVDLFRLAEVLDNPAGAEAGAAFSALGLHEDPRIGHEGLWIVEWGEYWSHPPSPRYECTLSMLKDPAQRRLSIAGIGERCATWIHQLNASS